jgi:hypothetical protein
MYEHIDRFEDLLYDLILEATVGILILFSTFTQLMFFE